MNPDIYWIKKVDTISKEQIELKYAKLFANRRGKVVNPLLTIIGHVQRGFTRLEKAIL